MQWDQNRVEAVMAVVMQKLLNICGLGLFGDIFSVGVRSFFEKFFSDSYIPTIRR